MSISPRQTKCPLNKGVYIKRLCVEWGSIVTNQQVKLISKINCRLLSNEKTDNRAIYTRKNETRLTEDAS